jgi:hypothetical protein
MPQPTPLNVFATPTPFEAPRAIGRVVNSEPLDLAIMALYQASAVDIPARPVVPAIHSFHLGFVQACAAITEARGILELSLTPLCRHPSKLALTC